MIFIFQMVSLTCLLLGEKLSQIVPQQVSRISNPSSKSHCPWSTFFSLFILILYNTFFRMPTLIFVTLNGLCHVLKFACFELHPTQDANEKHKRQQHWWDPMINGVSTHLQQIPELWSHHHWQPKESSHKGRTVAHNIKRKREKFPLITNERLQWYL